MASAPANQASGQMGLLVGTDDEKEARREAEELCSSFGGASEDSLHTKGGDPMKRLFSDPKPESNHETNEMTDTSEIPFADNRDRKYRFKRESILLNAPRIFRSLRSLQRPSSIHR